MGEFGISQEELAGIASEWRSSAGMISGLPWSAFNVGGSGSDVLAAIRACATPADATTNSIGQRYTTLAEKLDTFAANVVAQDDPMGTAIGELPQR